MERMSAGDQRVRSNHQLRGCVRNICLRKFGLSTAAADARVSDADEFLRAHSILLRGTAADLNMTNRIAFHLMPIMNRACDSPITFTFLFQASSPSHCARLHEGVACQTCADRYGTPRSAPACERMH